MKTPFLGTAYVSRSRDLSLEQCINLYPEIVETKQGAQVGAFYGTPGLDLLATVGNGPIRGMLTFNGNLYVVSGTGVYIVTSNFNVSLLGNIATGSGQVSMIANATQVALFDGIGGYSIVNGALNSITLPFSNPGLAVYQDGFGVVSQNGTSNIWQSSINDLTSWPALNYGVENGKLSNIVGIGELHRQIYVFKERGTFVWVNAGLSPFAFQRLDGVSLEIGCIAQGSICNVGDNLLWLSQNDQGQGVVYLANGYQPERVSTHGMEYATAQYPTLTDAIAYAYQQEGHYFYQITFPSGNETWVLDLTATRQLGYPAWHKRLAFSNGNFSRHQTATCQFFAGKVVVGDYNAGKLYAYNLNTYTDAGQRRKWLRSWRALPQTTSNAFRISWLEIQAETGGISTVDNPQMMLRQTFDSSSYTSEFFQPVGLIGATAQRIKFNRLGIERRGLSQDRVFELSSSDPYKVALLAAEIG